MADWTVEPLGIEHDRSAFSCGKPALDDFLRARASQYEKRRLGKTFVAVPPGQKRVIGYHTLAAGAVSFEHLPADATRRLPKHPMPVVLLARLEVDQTAQGRRLGEGLLLDALQRALEFRPAWAFTPSRWTRSTHRPRRFTASTGSPRFSTIRFTSTCRSRRSKSCWDNRVGLCRISKY